MLMRVERKNHMSSVTTLTTEFQTASGNNVSTITVRPKPKITMRNGKRWLEWCKDLSHWTLEQWKHVLWSDESCFTIW